MDYISGLRYVNNDDITTFEPVDNDDITTFEPVNNDDITTFLQHFFLMESGNTMFDFYTSIFEKISHEEFWQDASFLNMTLQESLHCDHPADVEKLSITVDPSVNSAHLLTVMNSVSMHYKVPWPVSIVINARSLAVYNQIFQFLLQIKWVKYALDGLRFPDLNDRKCTMDEMEPTSTLAESHKWSRNELIHRIQIFRMKILHFVNSLNNYIMTRILHFVCLEFQTEMETACDLDQVIAAHNAYVKTIHERCLLHKKVAFIKDMVSRVLQLGLSVQNLWNHSNVPLSPSMLLDMEKEFSRCVQFLSSMITQVTSRGSFPYRSHCLFYVIIHREERIEMKSKYFEFVLDCNAVSTDGERLDPIEFLQARASSKDHCFRLTGVELESVRKKPWSH